MKSTRCSKVRWVQPVAIGSAGAEPVTRADQATTLTAQDFGILIVRNGTRVFVPWSNVKQADADE